MSYLGCGYLIEPNLREVSGTWNPRSETVSICLECMRNLTFFSRLVTLQFDLCPNRLISRWPNLVVTQTGIWNRAPFDAKFAGKFGKSGIAHTNSNRENCAYIKFHINFKFGPNRGNWYFPNCAYTLLECMRNLSFFSRLVTLQFDLRPNRLISRWPNLVVTQTGIWNRAPFPVINETTVSS